MQIRIPTVVLDEQTEEGRYIIACARIRKISPAALVRRLLLEIGKSQLVGAVLDDAGAPITRQRGERAPNKRLYGATNYPL